MSKLMELVEEYGRDMARSDSAPTSRAAEAYRHCANDTLSEIRAAVQELERDAVRYRWLRDFDNGGSLSVGNIYAERMCRQPGDCGWERVEWFYEEDLDSAIDAAMEAANVPE